ncbi:swi5-like zinc finger protein [Geranomyces michiganensis]|nr:swi5-like zinc finger protein [Geranomyces michiganensis]
MTSTELLDQFLEGDARDRAQAGLDSLLTAGQIARRTIPKTDIVVYWIPPGLSVTPVASPARPLRLKAEEVLSREIANLRAKIAELEDEGRAIEADLIPGTDVEAENAAHIKRLHDYNEVKDTGQMLLGKLAECEGTTTRSMYKRFDLAVDD